MDPFSMLLGVVIFVAGTGFGRVLKYRSQPRVPRPPRAICGCEHHLSQHDPKTGICAASVKRARRWDLDGAAYSFEFVPCSCKRYIGPLPMDQVFAQKMILPD